jgi:hypothetical protein
MANPLKREILQSPALLAFIGKLSQFLHLITWKRRIRGKGNKTSIYSNVIIRWGGGFL